MLKIYWFSIIGGQPFRKFHRNKVGFYIAQFGFFGIGGEGYATDYTVKYLRSKQCTLPIELWYIDDEIDAACIAEMEQLGVHCKNLTDYNKQFTGIRGYMLKPFSIINSSFEEVLFLDADNICLDDPEKLFHTIEYLQTGAIFWPDYWKTAADNPIWDIMGVPFSECHEQESGQILIHKLKCWKALNLCVYLNQHHKVYHQLLLGDKDTFL